MKKVVSFLLVVIALLSAVPVSAIDSGSDANALEDLDKRMDHYISKRRKYTASVAISVVKDGKTEIEKYVGHSNIKENIKADEDTVYEWGSTTKLLVWTSVMQLHEQGKINLNEDISNYLPKDFLSKLSYSEPITMMHLMNHNAGFQELLYGIETTEKKEIVSLEEALKNSEPAQIYRPGEVCSYSNWGTALAALIVERVSRQPFYEYVNDHIFTPLGMTRSSTKADRSDNPWVEKKRKELRAYSIYEGGSESFGEALVYVQLYPAGAAAGTLSDFTKFLTALMPDDDGKSPLFKKKATYSKMITPSLRYENSDYPRVMHGLWYLPYGGGIIGHNGNTQACTSSMYFDPEKKMGVAIMTNELGETSYNYGLLDVVFGDYTKGSKTDFPEAENTSGIYTSSRMNFKHGVYKINKYFSPSWWKKVDRVNYKFAGIMKMKQINQDVFLSNNGDGARFINAIQKKNGKVTGLQGFTQDDRKENSFLFFAHIFLFLLFLFAIVISLVRVLFVALKKLYCFLFKKKKYRPHLMLSTICMVLVGVLVLWIVLLPGDIHFWGTAVKSIGIGLLSIYLLYALFSKIKQRKEVTLTRFDWFTLFLSLMVVVNVIFWEWFNFWTF